MIPMLRWYVSDRASTKYSNDDLTQALCVGARLVIFDVDFPTAFTVDVVGQTIDPDPTLLAQPDDNFVDLVTVKTAGIIDRGSATAAADQAIRVRDGASEVDLRAAFTAKLDLMLKGWNAVYQDMREQYLVSQRGVQTGAAVVSPFRLFSGYGTDMPFGTAGIYRWGTR
jgi:hypothetical protein